MSNNRFALSKMQEQLAFWQEHKFPKARPMTEAEQHITRMALGMAEEAGEAAHHILKGSQGIRGGIDHYNVDEIVDGICDCFIFGMQLLTALSVDVEKALEKTFQEVIERDFINFPKNGKTE